jgi:CheY-like chemotaxis protein
VGDLFGLCCDEIGLEFAPDIDTTPRTPAGVCRFAQARTLGYLVTLQGEQNGQIDAVWSAWCAATDRATALVAANSVYDGSTYRNVMWTPETDHRNGAPVEMGDAPEHNAVASATMAPSLAQSGLPTPIGVRLVSASILVVDDDPAICLVIAEALRDEGYAVATAQDGRTALDLARERCPDLVLTDIVMPGLSGPELHARLRLQGCYAPVAMMSAYAHERGTMTTPLLRKPFALEQLFAVVAQSLA